MHHLKIVHYRFYKSSVLVPILSQSDSVKTLTHYVISIHFNILVLFTDICLRWYITSFRFLRPKSRMNFLPLPYVLLVRPPLSRVVV